MSAAKEIGSLLIHLKSLMDVQERMLTQMMEHLLPMLVREREESDETLIQEKIHKLDEMVNTDAWRDRESEYDEQQKEKDVAQNYRSSRKEDEDKCGGRGFGENSGAGRRLFDMVG